MAGLNHVVYFNVFKNYDMHFLITPNIENGFPELNIIVKKYQYKDEFIINNSLGGIKLN